MSRASQLFIGNGQRSVWSELNMENAIRELASIYTEEMALKARKHIVDKAWDDPLPYDVQDFKHRFKNAMILLRSDSCTADDKEVFIESVFRAELRILLHQIVEIKRLDVHQAEDVCQEILVNLFKRILSDHNGQCDPSRKEKRAFQVSDDDYRSFIFYCMKSIKNFGSQKYKTNIHYTMEEYT
ncbi:MAG TPA: hypothetical protein ENI73_08255 [Spirochaetes bacterium]|nr:hypothetical protein [Spirochaetota bacterium]